MEDSRCWLDMPRRLLGMAYPDPAAGNKGTDGAQSPFLHVPVSHDAALEHPHAPPMGRLTPQPPHHSDSLVRDAYVRIMAEAQQQVAESKQNDSEDESDSSESSEYSESDDDDDSEGEESETELVELHECEVPSPRQNEPFQNTGAASLAPAAIAMDEGGAGRPQSRSLTERRPSSAPSHRQTPPTNILSSRFMGMSVIPSVLSPKPTVSGMSSMRAAAQALAQCVSRVVTGGESKLTARPGDGLTAQSPVTRVPRWPRNGTAPSNTALYQAQRSMGGSLNHANTQQIRRVPPAALMASPWWRNMEQQSPAFAAVSQRFQAIAQAQARERLASNLARLAVLHEAEEATRQQQDALRNVLGMPALAAWAQTKSRDPLPAFLLRTLAALLDLSVEMVKHGVLMGWVLLGVFNRLLFEVLTANRPVQTGVMLLAVLFAGYVGLLGDFADFESFFWDI